MSVLLYIALAMLMAVLLSWYVRTKIRYLPQQKEFREEVYRSAGILIDSEQVSDDTAEMVFRAAKHMCLPLLPWRIAWVLITGRARKWHQNDSSRTKAFADEFEKLPQHLQEQMVKLWVSWALAVTYQSVILGALLRRVALYGVGRKNKKRFTGGDDAGALFMASNFRPA